MKNIACTGTSALAKVVIDGWEGRLPRSACYVDVAFGGRGRRVVHRALYLFEIADIPAVDRNLQGNVYHGKVAIDESVGCRVSSRPLGSPRC